MGRRASVAASQAVELAREGIYPAEIARRVGMSTAGVLAALRRNGIEPPKHQPSIPDRERAEKMVAMFRQGLILQKIADEFDISRERVRQILKKKGITGIHGGQQLQARHERASHGARLDARCILKWGVSREEHKALRADGTVRAFESQRNHAGMRGIEWNLTLAQWLTVWRASGKLDQRGRGKGKYCMSRIKDDGGYVVGNVHIQLCTDNSREAVKQWRGKPAKVARGVFCLYPGTDKPYVVKVSRKQIGRCATVEEGAALRAQFLADNAFVVRGSLGSGRGWTYVPRMKSRPYFVQAAGQKVGYFATQDEAEAAYLAHIALVQQAREAAQCSVVGADESFDSLNSHGLKHVHASRATPLNMLAEG